MLSDEPQFLEKFNLSKGQYWPKHVNNWVYIELPRHTLINPKLTNLEYHRWCNRHISNMFPEIYYESFYSATEWWGFEKECEVLLWLLKWF